MLPLTISGIVITGSLMTWYLFSGRKNKADIYLGLFFMLLLITFLFSYFEVTGTMDAHPWLMFLDMGVPFLLGPLIWFYIISITGTGKRYKENRLFHLLPAIMIYILFADLIFLDPSVKAEIMSMPLSELGIRFQIENILQFLPVPVYIAASLFLIKIYERKLKTSYSSIQKINYRWLRLFLTSFLVYWFIIIAGLSFNYFSGSAAGYIVFLTGWIVFSCITGIYGIRHNRTIRSIRLVETKEEVNHEKDQTDTSFYNEFEDYIKSRKPFLDPELHINDLARAVNAHPYQLSRCLNTHYRVNFYDYINRLRVEEFKKRINSGEHLKYPILQLAYDCGFNSKTAFYRAFKKQSGHTPSDYINSIQQ